MLEPALDQGQEVASHRPGAVAADVEPSRRGTRFIFYANELIGLGQLRRALVLAARLSASRGAPHR